MPATAPVAIQAPPQPVPVQRTAASVQQASPVAPVPKPALVAGPMNMAGQVRQPRPVPQPPGVFETLPQRSRDLFSDAMAKRDAKAMSDLLQLNNRVLRSEFVKQTGTVLPKTVSGTKKAVADYFAKPTPTAAPEAAPAPVAKPAAVPAPPAAKPVPEAAPKAAPAMAEEVQTNTPLFQEWFKGSKAVDENGKPLKVFHGTWREFSDFDTGKSSGIGYFTTSQEVAKTYAGGTKGNVIQAYLSLQNPITVKPWDTINEKFIESAKKSGHDGIVGNVNGRFVYGVFDSKQIKIEKPAPAPEPEPQKAAPAPATAKADTALVDEGAAFLAKHGVKAGDAAVVNLTKTGPNRPVTVLGYAGAGKIEIAIDGVNKTIDPLKVTLRPKRTGQARNQTLAQLSPDDRAKVKTDEAEFDAQLKDFPNFHPNIDPSVYNTDKARSMAEQRVKMLSRANAFKALGIDGDHTNPVEVAAALPKLMEHLHGEKEASATEFLLPEDEKPALELARSESVEQQKARLARETEQAEEKRLADERATRAATKERAARAQGAKRLGGDLGSAGQGGLFAEPGQQEIFQTKPPNFPAAAPPPPLPGAEPGMNQAAIESQGPGAAAKGQPGQNRSAIRQLADRVSMSAAGPPAEKVSLARKLADAWAQGKGAGAKSWGRLQSIGSVIKSQARGLRPETSLDKRIAQLQFLLEKSAGENIEAKADLRRSIPNKTLREASSIWLDAGGDEAKIRAALSKLPAKTPPNVRRAVEMAANLSDVGKDFARDQEHFFGQRLADAQDAGIIEDGLSDYFTHIWKAEDNVPDALRGAMSNGQVNTYFQYSRQRKISTLLEGILAGKVPELDPVNVLPHYSHNLDRAIASRDFIKSLNDLSASDKRPAVVPTGFSPMPEVDAKTGAAGPRFIKPKVTAPKFETDPATGERKRVQEFNDYATVDHPAMRKWKWLGKDGAGKDIFMEGDLKVHPEMAERLKRMMDRGYLTPSKGMRAALAVSSEAKGLMFGLPTLFHPLHLATHALWHWTNPFTADVLTRNLDWDAPETKFAIEKGHLKLAPSPAELHQFSEGMIGGSALIRKIPILGDWAGATQDWIFGKLAPNLKLKTFENAFGRAKWMQEHLGAYKGLSNDEIAARIGDSSNNAFGELNHLFMGKEGRDPGFQRFLRLGFLAPDFGEARLRFAGKALTRFGHEERLALATNFLALYGLARAANYMSTGNMQTDWKHAFEVKVGNKWWGMRSMVGDINKATTDTRNFIMSRLNPVYARTLVEGATGRDYRGVKRDTWGQTKDLLKTAVPIPFSGATRADQTVWEGFLGSMGLKSNRESPAQYMGRLGDQFKKRLGKASPYEEIYDADADKYLPLRTALQDGDPREAHTALLKLAQTMPEKDIEKSIHTRLTRPFSGSKAHEQIFYKQLSKDDKAIYEAAQAEHRRELQTFNQAKSIH